MSAQGINFLFPVQTSTYGHIYDGQDVIVQASKHNNSSMMLKLSARNISLRVVAFYWYWQYLYNVSQKGSQTLL